METQLTTIVETTPRTQYSVDPGQLSITYIWNERTITKNSSGQVVSTGQWIPKTEVFYLPNRPYNGENCSR